MQDNKLLQKLGKNKSHADGTLRNCKLFNEIAIILLI